MAALAKWATLFFCLCGNSLQSPRGGGGDCLYRRDTTTSVGFFCGGQMVKERERERREVGVPERGFKV